MLSYSKYIIDAHAHIFPDKIAQKATDNIGSYEILPAGSGFDDH